MKAIDLLYVTCATSLVIFTSVSQASEPQRRYIGAFSNVHISEMSGDCGGISVQLWSDKRNAGSYVISGIFYDAGGTCPGSKSTIEFANYDPRSGKLDFTAKDRDTGVIIAEFRGRLNARSLNGRFGFGHQTTGKVDSWSEVRLRHLSAKDWARVGQ